MLLLATAISSLPITSSLRVRSPSPLERLSALAIRSLSGFEIVFEIITKVAPRLKSNNTTEITRKDWI